MTICCSQMQFYDLSSCWNQYPDLTGAFGKQYVISHDGKRDLAASEALNRTYHRTPDKAGIQPHAVPSTGLTQQFPNDCLYDHDERRTKYPRGVRRPR